MYEKLSGSGLGYLSWYRATVTNGMSQGEFPVRSRYLNSDPLMAIIFKDFKLVLYHYNTSSKIINVALIPMCRNSMKY